MIERAPILVVGAGGGVGGAVTRKLVARGDPVIAAVRSDTQAAALRREIPGLEDVWALDLAEADMLPHSLLLLLGKRPLSGVVNCAAGCVYGPLETSSLAAFRSLLEVNAVAALALFQACMPSLRQTRGRLLLVSSYSGQIALPFLGIYEASKFALEALADVMRQESAPFGVSVVVAQPGGIDTAMSRRMREGVAADSAQLEDDVERLYAPLYRAFARITAQATDLPGPDRIADGVIAAFDAPDPQPRYPLGEDARWLLEQRRVLDDRAMDALARQIYGLDADGGSTE